MLDVFKFLLGSPCGLGGPTVPVHLQLLETAQSGLQAQGEAGGEDDPGDGQPAGQGEQEEPQEEEEAEDKTERLEKVERPGRELRGGQTGEVECRVGVEMLQGGLLVSPALLQPFLQTNVGGGEGGEGVSYEVNVDLQIIFKTNLQHLRFT